MSECQPFCARAGDEGDGRAICRNIRAIYERRKREFVGGKNVEAQRKSESKGKKSESFSDQELIECIVKHSSELVLTRYGNLDRDTVDFILYRELGVQVGKDRLGRLVKKAVMAHPEIIPERGG